MNLTTKHNAEPQSEQPTSADDTMRAAYSYSGLPFNPELKKHAKELRKAGNLAEVLLWLRLKKNQVNGWDFDRQKIIGNYIVDFYSANADLVIEVDGSSHNDKVEYDAQRDEYLQGLGLTVLHFTDTDVRSNIDAVVETIKQHGAQP